MTTVVSPVSGKAVDLTYVPNESFASEVVGPGMAIDPVRAVGKAVAPIDGVVDELSPYQFTVHGDDGRGIRVYLGVDTNHLSGKGFHSLVRKGDRVKAGQPVAAWDVTAVESGGCSPIVPVVALHASAGSLDVRTTGPIVSGDALYDWW